MREQLSAARSKASNNISSFRSLMLLLFYSDFLFVCAQAAFSQTKKVVWYQQQLCLSAVSQGADARGCSVTLVGAGACRENVLWVVRVSKPWAASIPAPQHSFAFLGWFFKVWLGRGLRAHLVPTLPPWAGTSSTSPGCSGPYPAQPQTLPFVLEMSLTCE